MPRSIGADAAADAEMKPKGILVGVIALAAALLCGSAAQAERRVAFVIGNSAYKNATSLPNTINDANVVAALFRSVGFEVVTLRSDLGRGFQARRPRFPDYGGDRRHSGGLLRGPRH